jgi:nucleotide-binding universal stress UspA family protein
MTMARIQKILFPVNFSPSCIAMAPYVRRAATIFNAVVSLVHVVDPAELGLFEQYELYVRPIADILDDHTIVRKERLDAFLTSEFPLADSPRVMLSGDPASQISELAKNENFDLIIMPTHAGRFRQALLGSTTARVINDAPCPVLTSRHAETIAPRPFAHRHWICALDLTPYADTVLRTSKAFSEQAHGELSLIHVVNVGRHSRLSSSDVEESLHQDEVRRASDILGSLTHRQGLTAPTHIAVGSPKDALLQFVDQSEADVLIIGRSPATGSSGRLTDLTYAIVRDSPFPVLSL